MDQLFFANYFIALVYILGCLLNVLAKLMKFVCLFA